MSLVEAVWHLADYLSTLSWLDEQEDNRVRDMCSRVFEHCLRNVDSTDPVPRLKSELPSFLQGEPWEAGRGER